MRYKGRILCAFGKISSEEKCAMRTIGIFPHNVREKPFARHTIRRNFAAEIRKKSHNPIKRRDYEKDDDRTHSTDCHDSLG